MPLCRLGERLPIARRRRPIGSLVLVEHGGGHGLGRVKLAVARCICRREVELRLRCIDCGIGLPRPLHDVGGVEAQERRSRFHAVADVDRTRDDSAAYLECQILLVAAAHTARIVDRVRRLIRLDALGAHQRRLHLLGRRIAAACGTDEQPCQKERQNTACPISHIVSPSPHCGFHRAIFPMSSRKSAFDERSAKIRKLRSTQETSCGDNVSIR